METHEKLLILIWILMLVPVIAILIQMLFGSKKHSAIFTISPYLSDRHGVFQLSGSGFLMSVGAVSNETHGNIIFVLGALYFSVLYFFFLYEVINNRIDL